MLQLKKNTLVNDGDIKVIANKYQWKYLRQDIVNFPVDTGSKLNVNKTFRRGPGGLLNVLCAFNLRLVSTGLLVYGPNRPKQKQRNNITKY